MGIKMPYIHSTEEQKHQANAADLVEFICFKGELLLRSRLEFCMASNHSVTVRDGEWHDRATEKGGVPVSFLKEWNGDLCANFQQEQEI